MRTARRWLIGSLLVAAALLLTAGPALAQEFELPSADVEIQVSPDGSLIVTERITFSFDGSFSGAYREIPLGSGESVSDVGVSEGGTNYRSGASAELGSSGSPDTFGTKDLGDRLRVVWHYQAADEQRTFTITYRFTGLATAWDDVVDVNLQVWGSEWEVPVDRLTARLTVPGAPDQVLVWGHPASVEGTTSLGADGRAPQLEASDVPAGQWVELRVAFSRDALESVRGARVREGQGLPEIRAEEERAAEQASRDAANARLVLMGLVGLAVLPAPLTWLFGYLRWGREPKVAYDREYEQEPPSELPPALVGALRTQGVVGTPEFTATLFDLIRRGIISARSVQVERKTWMGLRTEMVSDLELTLGAEGAVDPAEEPVVAVMQRVLADGPAAITELRHRIREDVRANASSYQEFRRETPQLLVERGLLTRTRRGVPVTIAIGAAIVAGGLIWLVANSDGGFSSILVPAAIVVLIVNALLFFLMYAFRRAWVKRTPEGMLETERWEAFRRYLSDFSRLEEAPSLSLALWERYLVYAIAFGIADEVLASARLHAPEELHQSSAVYWYGHQGMSGGLSENAFSGLSSSCPAPSPHRGRAARAAVSPAGVEAVAAAVVGEAPGESQVRRLPEAPGVLYGVAGNRQVGGPHRRQPAQDLLDPRGRYGAGVLVVAHPGSCPAQGATEAGGDLTLVESARDYLALRLSGHLEVGDRIRQLHELTGVEPEEDDVGLVGAGQRTVNDGARLALHLRYLGECLHGDPSHVEQRGDVVLVDYVLGSGEAMSEPAHAAVAVIGGDG